jgi:hypothetical protein
MKESDTPHREAKAVQALISAALHASSTEVSQEELGLYLIGEIVLSADDETALERTFKRLPVTGLPASVVEQEVTDAAAFMALHRKKPEQGFAAKTEEEIRRKREELLEKLRKKNEPK